ncbi:MAG: type II toxin-antitoxin system VapC family toxin [Chloroflexi bacterium]|nr:type II toxin-antitoxin system VapC family toxin [Chloroflexota bacterium]
MVLRNTVLGFHRLTLYERAHFEAFFDAATILPLTQPILDQAVRLRQIKRMSLGDALVAATCLVHHLTLVTRNTADFDWIVGLKLLNPFDLTV